MGGIQNEEREKEFFFGAFDQLFTVFMYTDHYDYVDSMAIQPDRKGTGVGYRG